MGAGQAMISVATATFALSALFIGLIGLLFSLVSKTGRGIYFDSNLSILPAYECCTCADEIYRYELLQSLQKSQDLRLGQGRSWDVPIGHDSKRPSDWSRAVNVRGVRAARPILATGQLRGHRSLIISGFLAGLLLSPGLSFFILCLINASFCSTKACQQY